MNIQYLNSLLQQAVRFHQAGDLVSAERAYREILQMSPNNAEATHLLGLVFLHLGRLVEAMPLLERAVALAPKNAVNQHSLAEGYRAQGRLEAAEKHYRRAVKAKPDYAEAHGNLGLVLQAQGRLEEAVACYQRVCRLMPALLQGHLYLAEVLQEQGKHTEAKAIYESLVLKHGDVPELHAAMGNLAQAQRDMDAAILHYGRAIALAPNYADAHFNLGLALVALGRPEEAIVHYDKVLMLRPDASVHNALASALKRVGRLDDALAQYEKALYLNPNFVEALTNMGLVWRTLGQEERVDAYLRQAITLAPGSAEAHFSLSLGLLARGKFVEGWQEYVWRIARNDGKDYLPDPRENSRILPRPLLNAGHGFEGKRVLMVHDQGLGDELLFLRFVPALRRRGAWVAYCATPKLAALATRSGVLDMVFTDLSKLPGPFDHIFSVGDLPLLMTQSDEDALPPPVPLHALPDRLESMRVAIAALGPGPTLGLTWRAGVLKGSSLDGLLAKEVDLEMFGKSVRSWPGPLISLQRNPAVGEIELMSRIVGKTVHDFGWINDDLEDALAILMLLDEYVGVSNTNMHLRASLGKWARVLVAWPPEWRWMQQGDISPWFPEFKIYREMQGSGWGSALDRLEADLTGNS